MRAIILLLAIALMPVASAIECSRIPSDECAAIWQSNLTDTEKDSILVNLLYANNSVADHSLAYSWNTGLAIAEPPENIGVSSGVFIRNAWMKMLSVMPSVKEGGHLYVPFQAYVMSGYGYEVILPNNYYSSGYPSTNGGDCTRVYSKTADNAVYSVSDDSGKIGDSKLFSAGFTKNETLGAEYKIAVAVRTDHYRWNSYCCRWNDYGSCTRYCHDCEYSSSETKQDNVVVHDSLDVSYYEDNNPFAVSVLNRYSNTTLLSINESDVNYLISSGSSSYGKQNYFYSVNYSYKPYYVLQIVAEKVNETTSRNVFLDGNKLILKGDEDCSIAYNSFFTSGTHSCSLDFEPLNLSLTTDKLSYAEGEEIQVELFPKETELQISYGNTSVTAKDSATFTANSYNKITATHGSQSYDKIIHIKDKGKWMLLINLSFFTVLNYAMYMILRKTGGVLLG